MMESTVQLFSRLSADFAPQMTALSGVNDALSDMLGQAFDGAQCVDVFVDTVTDAVLVEITLTCDPLPFSLPGLGGMSLSIGQADALELEMAITLDGTGAKCLLFDAPIYVRCLESDRLVPVIQVDGKWQPDLDGNGQPRPFGVVFNGVSLSFDSNGGFEATTDIKIDVPPVRIGDTGLVIAMKGLNPCLSDNAVLPSGVPAGSRGFAMDSLEVWLPDSLQGSFAPGEIIASDLFLGTGGFTGKLSGVWTSGKPIVFGGMECTLRSLLFEFKQNALVASRLECEMVVPFFDQPADVEIALSDNGDFTVGLSATNGLVTLAVAGVLDIELDSLQFDVTDGKLTTTLSGLLTPTFGGLTWPAFDVKALEIDSEGHVRLSGGWIDLPKQYSLDFHGFKIEITKFGYGRNDDGTKWVGFSGGVELVKGLPAGASVEGLRITADEDWSNPRFSLNGVGIELAIPGVLQFKGDVAFSELDALDDFNQPIKVRRFDGDITLNLEAIDLTIDGTVVAGSTPTYNFFALYVNAELPTGFPVGPSGVAIYGLAGLLALHMGPDKLPDEKWYGFGTADGWYDKAPVGIENLKEKWTNVKNSRAFGAGVTLGTLSDNGYTFNGRVLLAVILPGPVVMLQGMANVLKDRSKLGDEAMFRSIAVFDKPAGSILFGVDAEYQYDEATGKLIKLHGSMEAYYNYQAQADWHLWLGKDTPRQDRIQARLFNLFDANAYFMLDPHKLAMGSWIGYDKSWNFGPLSVKLEAWMENNAVVSFKPLHLHGDLWVHGAVELRAFRFGAGLSVDARIEADIFRPFHLLGDFRVGIRLPKPFKSISADVRLEWGPQPAEPPTPIIIRDVGIEHLKSSVKWPLPEGDLLVPKYEDNATGNLLTAPTGSQAPNPNVAIPLVPMDCRPSIGFARNVWDRALTGTLPQPAAPPWERIGDPEHNQGPAQVQYSLDAMHLQKYDGATWVTVASTAGTVAPDSKLFGTWQITDAGGHPAQNKLMLWSKSGYDLYRNTGIGAVAQLADAFGSFPCVTPPGPVEMCLDFDDLGALGQYPATFHHPENSGVAIGLTGAARLNEKQQPVFPNLSGLFYIQPAPASVSTVSQILCPAPASGVWIAFAQAASNVRITAVVQGSGTVEAWVRDSGNVLYGPYAAINAVISVPVTGVRLVTLVSTVAGESVCLAKLCAVLAPAQSVLDTYADMAAHNNLANVHWSGKGNVLEPNTVYRLNIVTSANMVASDGSFNHLHQPSQYAHFQTSGPPGISSLSVPIGGDAANFDSGLDDLARYVSQTVPPTVPAEGQPPLSPRPVYCGYDVNVEFNEDYVSQMYRMAGRDLVLLLYDPSNQPVRDLRGALAVSDRGWGTTAQASLSATDQAWLGAMGTSPCVTPVDTATIPPDETLSAAYAELAPDTRYEARLVPSLLHEAFGTYSAGTAAYGPAGHVGRWQVHDLSTGNGSWWQVETVPNGNGGQRITQKNAIGPASLTGSSAVSGGTLLVLGQDMSLPAAEVSQPVNWSDVRVSLWLRTGAAPVAGVAFRYDGNRYYLFTLDGATRNLMRVDGTVITPLASDMVAHTPNQDYHVVIEALGTSIRVYVDDVRIFDVSDGTAPALVSGSIALLTSGGAGAAFSDIQAHDFSPSARPVYSFNFVTSPYLNFHHHLHSFNDGCWLGSSLSPPGLGQAAFDAAANKSVSNITAPVSDAEALAFEQVVHDVLGAQSDQCAARVEIHRIERAGATVGLLVRGPQPFGFGRASLDVLMSTTATPRSVFPLAAKIEAASVGAATPVAETVTVLCREATDLTGWRIEQRPVTANDLDDVVSVWQAIFTFPPGGVTPAGHQALVYSCSPDDAPVTPPKTEAFFRAISGQPGTLALVGTAADLRLVNAVGEVIHARRFLVDSSYGPLTGCKVLRKADETAFIILRGTSFTSGSYRLQMTYARDASGVLPGSPVLSEAGDVSTETVSLDFAWTPFG